MLPFFFIRSRLYHRLLTLHTAFFYNRNTENNEAGRTNAMTKLLFCDIDGTLVRSDGTISDRVRSLLKQMAEAGHGFILTSGRPLSSILKVRDYIDIAFPHSYIIANNGGLVYDCNAEKPVYEATLPFSMVDLLQNMAEEMQIHIQTYTKDSIVCRRETPEVLAYASRIKMPVIHADILSAPLTDEPYKMLALSLAGSEMLMPLKNRIERELGDTLQPMFSQNGYLEILPREANKGNALRFLCHHLQIPVSDSYAAGDSENDIAMLEAAGISYAMKNGDTKVKSSAAFVTALDHEHDGIAEVLETILSS